MLRMGLLSEGQASTPAIVLSEPVPDCTTVQGISSSPVLLRAAAARLPAPEKEVVAADAQGPTVDAALDAAQCVPEDEVRLAAEAPGAESYDLPPQVAGPEAQHLAADAQRPTEDAALGAAQCVAEEEVQVAAEAPGAENFDPPAQVVGPEAEHLQSFVSSVLAAQDVPLIEQTPRPTECRPRLQPASPLSVPRRSERLAKKKCNSKVEVKAQNVLMRKLGISEEGVVPDDKTLEEYNRTFEEPLRTPVRRALQDLLPANGRVAIQVE